MLLLFFLFLIGTGPIAGQDENSEDAFEIKRDKSQENEGMEGFVMSTAILEPEPSSTMATAVEEARATGIPVLPEEAMAEDPFSAAAATTPAAAEMAPISSSAEPVPDVPVVTTTAEPTSSVPSFPEETREEEETTTVDPNLELVQSTETIILDSTEVDETVPTIADVWTTSTETAERRVLKEKSGEELAKKDLPEMVTPETTVATEEPQETVATTEETTTKGSSEMEDEAPFDSSNLSGLFEADGSPKVDEPAPTFPLAHLPPTEQEEQSAEILDKEKVPKMTTEATTTIKAPEEEEETTEAAIEATEEETTTVRQQPTTERTTTTERITTAMKPVKMMEEPQRKVMMRPPSKVLTPITLKITSIEWNEDFGNNSSGKFKKLSEQILPELAIWLKNELGDDFMMVEIDSFTKGSVVVNAHMTTKEPIGDPEQLANRLESTITTGGNRLGGNLVDPATITVNGIPSRAYLDRVNASYSPVPTSPLLIAAIIGVAAVLLILIIVLICLINNRRSHGGMKMGSLPIHVEDSPPIRNAGVPQLNLMSYANSTRTTGISPRPDEREVV